MSAGERCFEVFELDGACAVVVVRGDDDLVSPDEDLVHEVVEELVSGLGSVNGCFSEALVERPDRGFVLVECGLDVLGLDRGIELLLLGFQGVHRLSGARVEDALRDRLNEIGELDLRVRATLFERLENLVSAPVSLLVVVREVHGEKGEHFGVSEEGGDDGTTRSSMSGRSPGQPHAHDRGLTTRRRGPSCAPNAVRAARSRAPTRPLLRWRVDPRAQPPRG